MSYNCCTSRAKLFCLISCAKASSSSTKKTRLDRSEFRKFWAKKLRIPSLCPKTKRRVKQVNWSLGLYTIAHFLHGLPSNGPPHVVIEKVSQTKCAYIVGSTLHVHANHLCTRNELNFISLVTHFQLVEEVRIHTFHLNYFLTARRAHVRIQSVHWELVKLVLQFVNIGPWVVKGETLERAIKITFDEFLKPVVEAWRSGLPYRSIVFDIPEYQTDIISTYGSLEWVHSGLSAFAEGYSSDSELEVGFAHEEVDSNFEEEYDIMKVNGYPFFLMSP